MKSRDFAFWLQGYLELANKEDSGPVVSLTSSQVACIQQHLALVFKHEIDPSFPDADELNKIHNKPQYTPGFEPLVSGLGPVLRC